MGIMNIPPNNLPVSSVTTDEERNTRAEGSQSMPVAVGPSGILAFEQRLSFPVKPAVKAVPVENVSSDGQLFVQAREGNKEALAELIERYKDYLYGLLVPLVNGDRHRAEDLFQDTFLNAMRAARTFDSKKSFRPWVTTIAVNLARDDSRRKKVRGEVALEGSDSEGDRCLASEPVERSESPSERAERVDEEQKVRRALTRLTQLEREVVLLHFYNDLTLQETAAALTAPLGTIKSRLHAALNRLSGILEQP